MMDQINELKLQVDQLEYENKLKTGLISLLSHDSKELFGSFLWLIEAVEQETISHEDFFKLLPQIKQGAKKNLQTVQDSTEWFKTQYGRFQIQAQKINTFELFQGLKEENEDKLQKKDISFQFKGDKNQIAKTDPWLINYVLSKLLDNAIKYSPRGQEVHFQSSSDDNSAILSIVDSGVGISENNLDTVFSFDTPVFEGTDGELGAGLSLKIVDNFVSLMKGSMKITSFKDKGTTVSIFLPKSENNE